jgi:hypothetical protein
VARFGDTMGSPSPTTLQRFYSGNFSDLYRGVVPV